MSNHREGRICFDANFSFPCNVIDMPFEFPKIRESTDVDLPRLPSCQSGREVNRSGFPPARE